MSEHTLADELEAFVEPVRARYLLEAILAQLEADVHSALQPDNIVITATDEIRLTSEHPSQPAGAPLHAFAEVMRAVFQKHEVNGVRPRYMRLARLLADECVEKQLSPTAALALLREQFDKVGLPSSPVPPWRTMFEPADTTERELVAALRANSGDAANREVYADWLEQSGRESRAAFVRNELAMGDEALLALAVPADALWRLALSRARLLCARTGCPERWDALDGDGKNRHCGTCSATVAYCVTIDDVAQQARQSRPCAVDASLRYADAVRAFESAAQPPASSPYTPTIGNPPYPRMPTANPPAPRPDMPPVPVPIVEPPPPNRNPPPADFRPRESDTGVLARFFGWFKRKPPNEGS